MSRFRICNNCKGEGEILEHGFPYPKCSVCSGTGKVLIPAGEQIPLGGNKSAVSWLVDYMIENFHLTDEAFEKFEQAKIMFERQIMAAYDFGELCTDLPDSVGEAKYMTSEQYYNETFKNE